MRPPSQYHPSRKRVPSLLWSKYLQWRSAIIGQTHEPPLDGQWGKEQWERGRAMEYSKTS